MKNQKKQQQERAKQMVVEANARRKVNKNWAEVEHKRRYKRAATFQACVNTTSLIEAECFDGILLQLNERNESKSYNSQKRILRRIVEKRQAQSVHRAIGRSRDRFVNHMTNCNISKSVRDLHRMSFCA